MSARNVRFWHVAEGVDARGETVAPLSHDLQGTMEGTLIKRLYDGLVEAMTNCRKHAYLGRRGDGFAADNRWWMFSQRLDDELTVVFIDLGIGIPRSLKSGRSFPTEIVDDLLSGFGVGRPDSAYIRAAMKIGGTRTKERHRGKGLGDLQRVIKDAGGGYLRVHSNAGRFDLDGKSRNETWKDYDDSILGTLIEWTLPLNQIGNAGEHDQAG